VVQQEVRLRAVERLPLPIGQRVLRPERIEQCERLATVGRLRHREVVEDVDVVQTRERNGVAAGLRVGLVADTDLGVTAAGPEVRLLHRALDERQRPVGVLLLGDPPEVAAE
jgi:hypothetical protein